MASLRARKQQAPLQTNVFSYLEQRVCGRRLADERHLIRNRLAMAKSLYRKDLVGHFGCVNAIEFTNGTGEWIVSGGDDRRVLVWNIQRALSGRSKPVAMKGQHNSNIFCLGFDMDNKRIFSGGNDEQVIYHDFETGATLDVFRHDDVVYGLSVDPNNNNVFASAADDGVVRVFDVRDPDPFVLADCTSSMHAVMYNPAEPRLLVTANNAYGAALWDIRKPKKSLLKYVGDFGRKQQHNCMSVRVNALGTQVIALYRRRPLMLYNIDSPSPVYKFSSADTEYANSCTMKSCSFAGDKDQYVLSGSDSFHVFVWPVPSTDYLMHRGSRSVTSTHMLLKGHRSIVNQVRYSPANHLLVSSGVEKVVKIWSAFPIPGGQGGLMAEEAPTETERVRFTQEQYMNIMLRQEMMHDYSNGDVEEDPHMMAFFDSLIAAGGDPWSSDDDSSDLYDIQPFIMYSETSSDSIDPQRDGVALSREQSVAESCEESEAAQNDALSSESATNTTQDDGTNNVSDSDPSDEETSGQRILTKLVESAPYRARANQAVKRLQRLRNRVENSETSDSDSSNSDTSASTSNGRLVKDPGKSVTQTESTDNESAPNNSSSKNCGDKVSITSNDCDTNPYGTSHSCNSKLYKCDSNNVDRANTPTCDPAHVAENPKSNSAPARQGSNGNVLKSNNNLHDRGPGSNRVCDHVDGLAPRGIEVNGNVYSKASTSATGLDNRTVLTESSDQQNSNDFKRLKKNKDRRQYRRKTSQNVSSEDDDP